MMITKRTLDFLKALKKNNNREWFDVNRSKYEEAKADFEKFVETLLPLLSKENSKLKDLKVKDCVFRIYRDVRFSKNKDPDKTNCGAYFVEGGKKSSKAGYYIQIEPGNSFLAGGCWMPEAPVLKAIRQEIDYNLKDFEKIVKGKVFKSRFGEMTDARLKTTPKGYDAENPAINYLRQTSFTVMASIKDKDLSGAAFTKEAAKAYKEMLPFLKFLNVAQD
ncbi:MAG: DUF2461 domain-containing protein [Bacteroidetes bacterium]|nr:DUF2461 domain-containing protein [Bacteroidota bacterium]